MTENKNDEKRTEPVGARFSFLIYANNEPKSALARDLGDCRDNKGKLAKRVFTCLREQRAKTRACARRPNVTRHILFISKNMPLQQHAGTTNSDNLKHMSKLHKKSRNTKHNYTKSQDFTNYRSFVHC